MVNKLRQFIALSEAKKCCLLGAVFWLPLMHFRLRYFGLRSCLRSLGLENMDVTDTRASANEAQQAQECEYAVALAARYGLVTGTCLSRSLTIMRLLSDRKVLGLLRVGVKLDGGVLDAHAWVEVGGVPLGQGELQYQVFPAFCNYPT